jgi:hypothetical protein
MKSIMQTNKECYLCRKLMDISNDWELHLHHIYEGWGNRKVSDRNGFTIWLCGMHHNLSDYGIHFNKDADLEVKQECQRKYEENHSREEFMQLIGRNYLDE